MSDTLIKETSSPETTSDTMMAVRNYGPRDYRLETIAKPTAGPGEVVIHVDAAGICGSDGKCFTGGAMFWDDPYVKVPVTPGHEFFGTVTELGEGAGEKHGLKVGDKAIAEQIYPCEKCRYCKRGQYWMCEVHNIYGFQREVADGAWADYMKFGVNARVHKVPDDMSLEAGVLIEPLACAIHAVERGEIQLGDTVVLAGAGTLGLLKLQVITQKKSGVDYRPRRQTRTARARQKTRRGCGHQHQRARPGAERQGLDRRLRRGRLYRGDRLSAGSGERPQHDP